MDNESNSIGFLKSRESVSVRINLFLSLLLLSGGNVLSDLFENNYSFNWTCCINIAISAVLIIFMGIFRNDQFFKVWINNMLDVKVGIMYILNGIIFSSLGFYVNYLFESFSLFIFHFVFLFKVYLFIIRTFEYALISMGFSLILLPFVIFIYKYFKWEK